MNHQNSRKASYYSYYALFASIAISASAQSFTETFDSNPPLGSNDPGGTAAPGLWYVDRFAPAAFDSVSFQGTNRLHVGVSASDFHGGTFYDTQGRKLYLANATVGSSVSAQLYIPSAWSSLNVSPSMWFTMYDKDSQSSDFPILSFYSSGSGSSYFRVWDGYIGYVNLDTPVAWDSWNTLSLNFSIAGLVYSINGTEVYTETAAIDAGSTTIANVMFQDKNYGTSYDAYWYNLIVTTPNISSTPVPEPTTAGLLVIGGMLALRVRKLRRY